MVLRTIALTRDSGEMPPRPVPTASLVKKPRRCRPSRYGLTVSNLRRIAASLITKLHTAQTGLAQLPHVETSDSIIVLQTLRKTATAAGLLEQEIYLSANGSITEPPRYLYFENGILT